MVKKLKNGKVLIEHDGCKVEAKATNGIRPSIKVTIRDKVAMKMYHAILPFEQDADLEVIGERYLQRALIQRSPAAVSIVTEETV